MIDVRLHLCRRGSRGSVGPCAPDPARRCRARARGERSGLGPGRTGHRADDRRGVLGEPAPRRGDGAEDLARVPDARGGGDIRSCSSVAFRSIRQRSRACPPWSSVPASILAWRYHGGELSGVGDGPHDPEVLPASSKSPSRVCSSSSTIAARRRPSSSTLRCCRATPSRSSTSMHRACPTARRC